MEQVKSRENQGGIAMRPNKPPESLGCMGCSVVAAGAAGFGILCLTGRPEVGTFIGLTVFLVLAACVGVGRLFTGKKRKPVVKVKKPAKAALTGAEPKPPTKAEILRKAGEELHAELAVIDALVMDEDEKDILRALAQDTYEAAVAPYLKRSA
jgi:hypothetical protein